MKVELSALQTLIEKEVSTLNFKKILFTGKNKNANTLIEKIEIRPVLLKEKPYLQIKNIEKRKNDVTNIPLELFSLNEYLELGFQHLIFYGVDREIDYRFTKSKEIIKTEKILENFTKIDLAHDLSKKRVLISDSAYLRELGVTDKHGEVKRNMADKYRQIEKFVELAKPVINKLGKLNKKIEIVDCGSGSAYLTFALAQYCAENKINFKMLGLEARKDLTDKSNALALKLGMENEVEFIQSTIEQYSLKSTGKNIDLLVALHACNTATDEAIALGIKLDSKFMLIAPCCHNEIQKQLKGRELEGVLDNFLKFGIVRERFGDLVTDLLRTLYLKVNGFTCEVIEFVDTEHTPRNLLIRAEQTGRKIAADQEKLEEFEEVIQIKSPLAQLLN
jgi:hypothetical protein